MMFSNRLRVMRQGGASLCWDDTGISQRTKMLAVVCKQPEEQSNQ